MIDTNTKDIAEKDWNEFFVLSSITDQVKCGYLFLYNEITGYKDKNQIIDEESGLCILCKKLECTSDSNINFFCKCKTNLPCFYQNFDFFNMQPGQLNAFSILNYNTLKHKNFDFYFNKNYYANKSVYLKELGVSDFMPNIESVEDNTFHQYIIDKVLSDYLMTKQFSELVKYLNNTGLPPGVVNMVHGGEMQVERICSHPDVKAILYDGDSTENNFIQKTGFKYGKKMINIGTKFSIMPDESNEIDLKSIINSENKEDLGKVIEKINAEINGLF